MQTKLIAELDANASNVRLRTYTWGTDLSGTISGAGGVGGLLWVNNYQGAPTGQHFVAYDGNGNVAGLIKASDASLSARYEYGPFGESARTSGIVAKYNPVRWSSKCVDDETGLVCYAYRYYHAATGRWLSRDPIEELGGLNINESVGNNPISIVDSDGRAPVAYPVAKCGFAVGALIGGYIVRKYNVVEYDKDANVIHPRLPLKRKPRHKNPLTIEVNKCTILVIYGHNYGGDTEHDGINQIEEINGGQGCSYSAVVGCYVTRINNMIPLPGYEPANCFVGADSGILSDSPTDLFTEYQKIDKAIDAAVAAMCARCACETIQVKVDSYGLSVKELGQYRRPKTRTFNCKDGKWK